MAADEGLLRKEAEASALRLVEKSRESFVLGYLAGAAAEALRAELRGRVAGLEWALEQSIHVYSKNLGNTKAVTSEAIGAELARLRAGRT